jgi:lysophospholipase
VTGNGPSAQASFRSPDGSALAYRVVPAETPRAAVVLVHGWFDHMGRWSWVAEQLRDAGYSVFLYDLRGHGRSAGRRGHLARFSQLLADLHAFRRTVVESSGLPQVLFGHSLGALVVLRYLETDPDLPVQAAVAGTPFLALGHRPPGWKLAMARLLAHVASGIPIIPVGFNTSWLSRDPAVNQAYRADPLVHRRMTPGAWREILEAQALTNSHADRIVVPLLVLVPGADRIADPQVTLEFAHRLTNPVTVRHYPDMLHELLNDPERQRVMNDIVEYLRGAV